MHTIIDSAPSAITIPRDACVEVIIVAHNDDGSPAVLGIMDVLVGDTTVRIAATLPAAEPTPVNFSNAVLSPDLVAAGVTVQNLGNGHYSVCGPNAPA